MFRAARAPWRSPLKGVRFSCGCPAPSSAVEEGARGQLQGPVLANPPPRAGQSCTVVTWGCVGLNAQLQLWCGIRDFSNSHASAPQSWCSGTRWVFRELLSEQMCDVVKVQNVLKAYGKGFPDHAFC